MRELRLRKENIQIGDEDALQKLFKEDRGNHYFISEMFVVATDLIPNFRDSELEKMLKTYCQRFKINAFQKSNFIEREQLIQ